MGKQSSLGPIDPQFGAIAAANLIEEIKKAKEDIASNPNLALFWNPILSKITPSFLERCEWAISNSNEFIKTTLKANMFAELDPETLDNKIDSVSAILANNAGKAHNTHIQYDQCNDIGLSVSKLEDDQKLQDLVLTIHHCYMHSFSNTGAFKIIENHLGRAMVKMQQMQIMQGPMSLGISNPA
jgi:hypothetical protein